MKKNYIFTLLMTICMTVASFGQYSDLFISMYAEGSSNNKFIEIYNGTGSDIDLSNYMIKGTNNGGDWKESRNLNLTGIITAGDVYVISTEDADASILAVADLSLSYDSPVHYNGDDAIALLKKNDSDVFEVIDIIGATGDDPGSGWAVAGVTNATKDHTLTRKNTISGPSSDWSSAGSDESSSQWVVTGKDTEWTSLGSYEATSGSTNPLEGSWSFTPEAGAMGVGPNPGDYSWWSNNEADVAARSCLFDDEYVFNADGSFTNVQGSDTWTETWQTGVTVEGCGAAVAPHDGSNAATYTVDATAGTVTIVGSGAYLGLSKVTNQGEDGAPTNDTATYSYAMSADGTTVDFTIQGFNAGVATAEWIFKMTKNDGSTAGISDNKLLKISMYPNPTSSRLTISAQSTIKSAAIYNLLGKEVMNLEINKNSESIDVSNLASGMYLIRYSIDNAIGTAKFIKQ